MSVPVVPDGVKDGFQLAKEANASGAVALLVDGRERDLAYVPGEASEVHVLTQTDELGRRIVRHSAAHVLAQAVLRLYPEAKYAIGPPIEDGFYYDFEVPRPFAPDDLEGIEAEMRNIVGENQRFVRAEVSAPEALRTFADQPYKSEIIEAVIESAGSKAVEGLDEEEVGPAAAHGETDVISLYRNTRDGEVAFVDLCRGPHVPGTGRIKAFKLLRSSGAYWRGDEKQPMLQRIYGTAWESKDALEAYLHRLAEAERRDHRRIGRELDLYSWPQEVGPGLALWHPKGAIVRK